MISHQVKVFFYGSYINFEVLAEAEINQRDYRLASLSGYELTIAPLANLQKNPAAVSFGILTQLSHVELEKLYQEHSLKVLGGRYLPEAVIVHQTDGSYVSAMTYICHDMQPAKPVADYVDRILMPATEYGFPQDYLNHIASFKS